MKLAHFQPKGVFAGLAELAIRAPRWVLGVTLMFIVSAAVFGAPVIKSLPAGGFQDPTSQSWQAAEALSDKFGQGDMPLIVTGSADAAASNPEARRVATDLVEQLKHSPNVAGVTSAWTAPESAAHELISRDGKTGLIVAGITGGEDGAPKHAKSLAGLLHDRDGVTLRAGGEAMTYLQITEQSQMDLVRMEAIALPMSFVVLVWVFGGLLSAALPVAVGASAIVGSLAILRVITRFTDVSMFALNLTTALGFALAVDYTLLIVSRFRDEMAGGADRADALRRTMATAGRTVAFSAMTVALSMTAMVLFPMYFLKSFAYAGVAVVSLAAAAALIVTPAAIVVLGDRLQGFDVREFSRRLLGRPEPRPVPVEETLWCRSAKAVMRRAVPVCLAVAALLVLLGAPFTGVKWGFSDDRVLPPSTSARQVGDLLRSGFASNAMTNMSVVIPDMWGANIAALNRYAAELSQVPEVASVSSPGGTFKDGAVIGAPVAATGLAGGSAFLTVNSTAPLYSAASELQLDRLHAVKTPDGRQVQMGGIPQTNRDTSAAVDSRLPLVLALIAIVTVALLFLLTGSIILPLKALLLNVLSLTASFGALVWIFQDGHLGAFGTTASGTLIASVPVLLFCVAFGLSMDYEVFLVSRIREFWLISMRTRAANDESVALGLARTGRVVSAAALLMVVSFAALTSAEVSIMKMFGVGLTLAVLVDATLVRMVLLPAVIHLLGPLTWWAPAPLAWLHRRLEPSDSEASRGSDDSDDSDDQAGSNPAVPTGRNDDRRAPVFAAPFGTTANEVTG